MIKYATHVLLLVLIASINKDVLYVEVIILVNIAYQQIIIKQNVVQIIHKVICY